MSEPKAGNEMGEGWQLVPTKHNGLAGLTHEMCDAFWDAFKRHSEHHGHFESTNVGYNAMLAAAPAHPFPQGGDTDELVERLRKPITGAGQSFDIPAISAIARNANAERAEAAAALTSLRAERDAALKDRSGYIQATIDAGNIARHNIALAEAAESALATEKQRAEEAEEFAAKQCDAIIATTNKLDAAEQRVALLEGQRPIAALDETVVYRDRQDRLQRGKVLRIKASWNGYDDDPLIIYTVEHPTYRNGHFYTTAERFADRDTLAYP